MLWDPGQYLQFGEQRTQVSRDLVARVARRLQPRSIVDLGCGPGNSTAVLHEQWPQARLTGLDAAPEMLAAARQAYPELEFQQGEIDTWASAADPAADLIFANSALQWVADWPRVLPQLLQRVAPGGAFAFQVPANQDAPAIQIVRDLAAGEWRDAMRGAAVEQWHTDTLAFFWDTLAPHAAGVELWETTYVQAMADVEGIVEWYKGSGLRPYLQALRSDAERDRFLRQYMDRLRAAYPARPAVLFPFLRRFAIAWAPT